MFSVRLGGLRRGLLAALLSALAAGTLHAQKDNVLILIADDLGVDHVGIYAEGGHPPPTPNLDALARRGVFFRNAWANPVCSPTRSCLQTGRYGTRTGVGAVIDYEPSRPQIVLPPAELTLPEVLDAGSSGYAHAAIGKWHLDEAGRGPLAPNLAGWSHFAGFLGKARYNDWARTVNGKTAKTTAYCTTQSVDDALAWIATVPEPWVVYLAFLAPHKPFHKPPSELHTRDLEGLAARRSPVRCYKAAVEAMDTEIGRLFGSLGPALSRTNVIFLGDNGTPPAASEAPFLPSHAKGTPYEGGVNVPLIVAGPCVGDPGREEAALVAAVDVFSTVVELCGAKPQTADLDGVSFVPHLAAAGHPPLRTTVFAEWFEQGYTARDAARGVLAIRNQRYKLVRHREGGRTRDEFYDLSNDPFETEDLLPWSLTEESLREYGELIEELVAIRGPSARKVVTVDPAVVEANLKQKRRRRARAPRKGPGPTKKDRPRKKGH